MTNLNAILREQIQNTAGTEQTNCTDGTSNITCTYPNVLSFTSAPHAPTFYRPVDGATNVSTTPIVQLKSADTENDYVQYVVEYCLANSWPCSSGGGSFDQTASQTNWNGQDANGGTAYIGNFSEANSTLGVYSTPPGIFKPTTVYYMRAKAIDPGGSNTYSPYSSVISFTTASLEVLIKGGTCIGGVGASCTSGSGSFQVKIGN
jgi:hypothetical protein